MATRVHQQVDAGVIGYDTPVAEVWPEFAAHGKRAVTVRHVLTHSAGVPGVPVESTIDGCGGSPAPRSATTPTPSATWPARSSAG